MGAFIELQNESPISKQNSESNFKSFRFESLKYKKNKIM